MGDAKKRGTYEQRKHRAQAGQRKVLAERIDTLSLDGVEKARQHITAIRDFSKISIVPKSVSDCILASKHFQTVSAHTPEEWLAMRERYIMLDSNMLSYLYTYMTDPDKLDAKSWTGVIEISACASLYGEACGTTEILDAIAFLEDDDPRYIHVKNNAIQEFRLWSKYQYLEILEHKTRFKTDMPLRALDNLKTTSVFQYTELSILALYVEIRSNKQKKPREQLQGFLNWCKNNHRFLIVILFAAIALGNKSRIGGMLKEIDSNVYSSVRHGVRNAAFDCYLILEAFKVNMRYPDVGVAILSGDKGLLTTAAYFEKTCLNPDALVEVFSNHWSPTEVPHIMKSVENLGISVKGDSDEDLMNKFAKNVIQRSTYFEESLENKFNGLIEKLRATCTLKSN